MAREPGHQDGAAAAEESWLPAGGWLWGAARGGRRHGHGPQPPAQQQQPLQEQEAAVPQQLRKSRFRVAGPRGPGGAPTEGRDAAWLGTPDQKGPLAEGTKGREPQCQAVPGDQPCPWSLGKRWASPGHLGGAHRKLPPPPRGRMMSGAIAARGTGAPAKLRWLHRKPGAGLCWRRLNVPAPQVGWEEGVPASGPQDTGPLCPPKL